MGLGLGGMSIVAGPRRLWGASGHVATYSVGSPATGAPPARAVSKRAFIDVVGAPASQAGTAPAATFVCVVPIKEVPTPNDRGAAGRLGRVTTTTVHTHVPTAPAGASRFGTPERRSAARGRGRWTRPRGSDRRNRESRAIQTGIVPSFDGWRRLLCALSAPSRPRLRTTWSAEGT